MKVIKISNGEVHIKDIITRGLQKDINKAMVANTRLHEDGAVTGMGVDAIDRANDAAVLGMVEKIVIDGYDRTPSMEVFDNMDKRDFKLIVDAINEIDKQTLPKD